MEVRSSGRMESPLGYHSWIAGFLTCGRESGRGTLLGRQFDWGGRLLKGNGGAQRLAPQGLTTLFLSLPPILYIRYRIPMISYSKALRGLSVQSRVMGIFTHTSISPSPLLRQRPSRYAIRAGRNLPDKEFRYLRTVIVTAAVYWGFDSLLRCLTTPLNLPAPGRRQLVYVSSRFRTNLCFC